MSDDDSKTNVKPMTPEQTRARARLLKKLKPGDKLEVTAGLKKGREATYVGPDASNPHLLRVTIERVPRVVKFEWVEIKKPS